MCAVHGPGAGCKCGYALFLGAALACLGCSAARPDVCSERDAALLAHEAQCLALVKAKCAGIPEDEPCPFEDECVAVVKERCK